jgi:SAM-dependent methyltransferase
MIQTLTTDLFPLVSAFQESLKKTLFGSSAQAIDQLREAHGEVYLADFERYLNLLRNAFPEQEFPEWAARGFQRLGSAILREEVAFKKTGHYSAGQDEFDSLREEFYDNPEVMDGYYLIGLFCSYFLWPHHYRLLNFYRDEFLSRPMATPGLVMEWGPGHGLLGLEALKTWDRSPAVLIDLSAHSLQFCERIHAASAVLERCDLRRDDILACETLPQADRIICGELLEHVPDPRALVRQLRSSLQPGGTAFLTGAINAPQPDHIFLFRNARELLDLVEAEDLAVRSHLTVRHPSRETDESAPEVIAMVVEHAA